MDKRFFLIMCCILGEEVSGKLENYPWTGEEDGVRFSQKRFSLSFVDKGLEKEFIKTYLNVNMKMGRICHFIAVFFYSLVAFWDFLVIAPERLVLWIYILPVVTAIFFIGLTLSYLRREWYSRFWQSLFAFYVLITGTGFTLVTALSSGSYPLYNLMGIIFCLIFCYTFIRLTFPWAAGSGNLLIFLYTAALVIFTDLPSSEIITQFFYLFGINLLGMMICYSQEYLFRRWYINNQLLKEEQTKSRELNTILEERLIQSQKTEALGQLAGGVAHDYNNISGVIIGYSELIKEELPTKSPLYAYADQILEAAKRATDITGQLLAFARKQTITPQVLDINKSIESMLKILRRLIGENISLSWKGGEDLWPVKIDSVHMDQILANLVVNARDAIENIGTVRLETGKSSEKGDGVNYVYLSVSDNGQGMDEKTSERIFEPFFTTKETGKGTGLGLSTVLEIVEQNGGYIDFTSKPGKGSTFKIFFPRHREKKILSVDTVLSDPEPGKGETLLLVEDDVNVLNLGKNILEQLGYRVFSTSSPGEAEKIMKKLDFQVDLLVTDVIMPEMNGRQLSELLTTMCPPVKTLYISAYAADLFTLQGILDEGVNFLSKPFTKNELAHKIRQILDGNSPLT